MKSVSEVVLLSYKFIYNSIISIINILEENDNENDS